MKNDNKKEVKISNYLWDFLKTNENLVFLKWPEQRQHEFAEIKKLNADRRIILSKIREHGVWDIDTAKMVNPYKFYRFKSDVEPIFTDEYVLPIVQKKSYIISKERTKEIVKSLLTYIKSNKDGFSYNNLSKYIVEKFFNEEYVPSYNQAHSSMFGRFINHLNRLGIIKVNDKYVFKGDKFTESIKDFSKLDQYKLFTKIVKENDIFNNLDIEDIDTSILSGNNIEDDNDIQKSVEDEPYKSGILNFDNPDVKRIYTSLILKFKPSETINDSKE